MRPILAVPPDMLASLTSFLERKGVALDALAADSPGAERAHMVVRRSATRQQSSAGLLYAGGWITCEVALGLSSSLGLPSRQVGALMDELEIKVRACSLGCFK